jgi:hypothetical protein
LGCAGFFTKRGVGVRDGSFISGDDMLAALECRADVRKSRLTGGWIERGDFGDNFRLCTIEKVVDGPGRRAEAVVVVGRAVPRGVDPGDLEGILAALALPTLP